MNVLVIEKDVASLSFLKDLLTHSGFGVLTFKNVQKEISEVMSIPMGTVMSRIYRGRKSLVIGLAFLGPIHFKSLFSNSQTLK